MKLSILIPTMPNRYERLGRLVNTLAGQVGEAVPEVEMDGNGEVKWMRWTFSDFEVLALQTPPHDEQHPEYTVGVKRQHLLEYAQGEMVEFIDDDDELHKRFLPLVLDAIQPGVDCIGFKVACYGYAQTNGEFDPSIMEPADVSIRYPEWANDQNGFKYVRTPHHIMPIRREHALKAGFPAIHHGEDHAYSMRLKELGLLQREVYINEFMYIYRFNAKKTKGE